MGVVLQGFLRCETDEQAALVRSALPEHVRLTLAEPGCVSFNVTPTDDPLVWRVAEEFTDPTAFEAHQTRAAASEWARQTAGIPRDYKVDGLT